VNISEMRNWLDKRHWQSKAAGFLTHAFNKGWFVNAMSKRKESPLRESNYCYPNVLAEIQPGPLQQFAGTEDIETGFLGRFLIASAVANDDCPVCSDLQAEVRVCMNSVEALRALDCDVRVPDAYSRPLTGIFHKHGAKPASSWKRICNEYYPRLALILSVRPDNTDPQIVITEKAWAGARIMCQYFFGQAEAVLNRVFDDPAQARFERICERIYTIIRNAGSTGVLVRDISHLCGMGTKSKDRREALEELLDRGTITEMKLPNGTRYFAG